MKNYHLLFYDPFVVEQVISKYIEEKFRLNSINIGHLFGKLVYVDQKEIGNELDKNKISYYSVFERINIDNIGEEDLLIPDYPSFLENLTNIENLIKKLLQVNYKLDRIWYVQNIDLKHTIEQSLLKKGDKAPFQKSLKRTLENAKRIQKRQSDLIKEVALLYSVSYLSTNSYIELSATTQSQIDKFVIEE